MRDDDTTLTAEAGSSASQAPETRARIGIPVAGMTCASCVTKVEKALTRVSGVREARVAGEVLVETRP